MLSRCGIIVRPVSFHLRKIFKMNYLLRRTLRQIKLWYRLRSWLQTEISYLLSLRTICMIKKYFLVLLVTVLFLFSSTIEIHMSAKLRLQQRTSGVLQDKQIAYLIKRDSLLGPLLSKWNYKRLTRFKILSLHGQQKLTISHRFIDYSSLFS